MWPPRLVALAWVSSFPKVWPHVSGNTLPASRVGLTKRAGVSTEGLRPSSLWTSHPALSLRPSRSSGGCQSYRRRRRCNNWLTPFLAVRCARGSRASLSAPRRNISPRLPLPFSFLDTTRPPLLGCTLTKGRSYNRYAPARSNLRLASTKVTFAIGDTGDLYYREIVHAILSY